MAEVDNETGRLSQTSELLWTSTAVFFKVFSFLKESDLCIHCPFLANKHQIDGERPVFCLFVYLFSVHRTVN